MLLPCVEIDDLERNLTRWGGRFSRIEPWSGRSWGGLLISDVAVVASGELPDGTDESPELVCCLRITLSFVAAHLASGEARQGSITAGRRNCGRWLLRAAGRVFLASVTPPIRCGPSEIL